jgi:uncharacterized damage-inducible protein DinB
MSAAPTFAFLTESYATERLKILSVWSSFHDDDLRFRCAERARTPLEQMVHQCVSESTWLKTMFGLESPLPVLPADESRLGFMRHYAVVSEERLARLEEQTDAWWSGTTTFFDVPRSRAWVFVRRIAHSAHHRGQLMQLLRLLGRPVYSNYGPTADTGGLFLNGAPTIYKYDSVDALLAAESQGGGGPALPGPGEKPATERP